MATERPSIFTTRRVDETTLDELFPLAVQALGILLGQVSPNETNTSSLNIG